MSDSHLGPGASHGDPVADPAEQQLRKALGTMNDFEPPADDLFVQRALNRGRARTARRRSTVLGAAAALVVVGAVGGTWVVAQQSPNATTSSAGSAGPEAANDSGSGQDKGATTEGLVPVMPGARDASRWFSGTPTPQTSAFESVEPTLVSSHPDVFSGAYAADASNTRIVVALTRPDPAVESLVTAAMPSPDDVSFVLAEHSIAEKEALADRIAADSAALRAEGVAILAVRLDGRADRVVVVADEGTVPGRLVARYGSLVTVVPGVAEGGGKLPDGSTLPPLQR
jgi:hypothetical protein